MAARGCQWILLMCAMAGLVASCAGEKKKQEVGVSWAGWIPPEQIPPALEEIGVRAVNIIDLAAMGDWPRVYAQITAISSRWADYKHPTVVPPSYPWRGARLLYGQLDTVLARLQEAAAQRNGHRTMQAANDVDAAAIELMEYYHPTVPGDLRRLAVLERRIMLAAWEGKPDTAAGTMIEIRRLWIRVRPTVVDHSSEEVARAFDYTLAKQQVALNAQEPRTVSTYAQNALIALTEMQQLSY
jgi:hypothetical protein